MLKTKATEILGKLNDADFKNVKAFVSSPLYNKNKNIINLYEALRPYYPGFDDNSCTKELIYRKIYMKKDYNDKIMRNLLSEFYKLLEDYIVYLNSQNPRYREMLLFSKLIDFDDFFLKRYNDAVEIQKRSKIGQDYFFHKIYLNESRMRHFLDRGKQYKILMDALHKGENQIFDLLFYFDEIIYNIYSNEVSFNIDFGTKISESFFKHFDYTQFITSLKKANHPEYEVVKMLYHKFMLSYTKSPDNLEHAQKLTELLKKNYEIYDDGLIYNIFSRLDDFYHEMVEEGKSDEVAKEKFNLYNFWITSGKYKYDEMIYMRDGIFLGAFHTALLAEEIDWAEQFVINYIEKLEPASRKYYTDYTSMYLNFRRKKYYESLKSSMDLEFRHEFDKIYAKLSQLQAYYELFLPDNFFSVYEALRKQLNNADYLYETRKQNYKMFSSTAYRLMNLRVKGNYKNESLIKIKEEIIEFSKDKNLSAKKWLLEKIDELNLKE